MAVQRRGAALRGEALVSFQSIAHSQPHCTDPSFSKHRDCMIKLCEKTMTTTMMPLKSRKAAWFALESMVMVRKVSLPPCRQYADILCYCPAVSNGALFMPNTTHLQEISRMHHDYYLDAVVENSDAFRNADPHFLCLQKGQRNFVSLFAEH